MGMGELQFLVYKSGGEVAATTAGGTPALQQNGRQPVRRLPSIVVVELCSTTGSKIRSHTNC
jgi:hypothetical protein